jgi:hypothetical protein
MKLALSHVLFYLGDLVSKLPHVLFDCWYPLYNWLMLTSVRLDADGVIWKREGVNKHD